jgi:uncharacterized protein YbaR (Trm112 family)
MTRDWELDDRLRGLLVCPDCRGPLEDRRSGLACEQDQLLFPVENGVPVMVVELARPLEDRDK